MKIITAKQQERSENKKKKLAALANLVQLNDKDRAHEHRNRSVSVSPPKDADEDGFQIVAPRKSQKNNKKTKCSSNEDEPQIKRVKIGSKAGAGDGNDSSSSATHSQDEGASVEAPKEQDESRITLNEDEYKMVRRQMRERKRELETVSLLRLRETGRKAELQVAQDQRTPIFLTDIQHLVMSTLLGKKSPCTPDRWCFVDRAVRLSHTVVVVVEGLSLYHFLAYEQKFEQVQRIFETRLEVLLPPCAPGSILGEMAQVPLTNVQAEQLIDQYGSLESAIELNKDPMLLINAIFPIELQPTVAKHQDLLPGDKFPRTKLLLSALQMVDEGYPMPLRGELRARFEKYVCTADKYAPVTNRSPIFGVDCEMCRTNVGYNELTRISIVNEDFVTIYETLVMPSNTIIDYLTPYSGITPEIMKSVTKTLQEVQRDVRALLPPDAILVGQSLNSDLNAMQMMHPYVIDTSVCFNLTGLRRHKSKLQTLAMTFLKQAIQKDVEGHDSVEDSIASVKLVKLKLANSVEFGDEILLQKKRLHEIISAASGSIKNNLVAYACHRDKRTAVVSAGPLQPHVKDILNKAELAVTRKNLKSVTVHETDSNRKAVKKTREVALEHALTIANLCVTPDELRPDVIEATCEEIDRSISKIWKTIGHNGLFVVVMGGAAECPSGVAQITIKRSAVEVAAKAPLAI